MEREDTISDKTEMNDRVNFYTVYNSAYNAVSISRLRTLVTRLLINAFLRKTRQRPDSYQYLPYLMKTFTTEFVETSGLVIQVSI